MSTTTRRRLVALETLQARKANRGQTTVFEEIRTALERVDGQHELDMQPGEDLFTVAVRRLQPIDGWNLDLIPGNTLESKIKTIDYHVTGDISPEARHTARHWFAMVEGL